MKYKYLSVIMAAVIFTIILAGCGGGSVMVNKEASTSAIRAAEEVGASKVPSASLYLQLAKEELAAAKILAANGEKEQSESMLSRAQADAELAVALSRGESDKSESTLALEKVRKLRSDNNLPQERK